MENRSSDSEEQDIRDLIDTMKAFLTKNYAGEKILRNFHPKMHGCLKGWLQIRSDIPEHLRCGLFKTPARYEVWIRFSNAPPKIKS